MTSAVAECCSRCGAELTAIMKGHGATVYASHDCLPGRKVLKPEPVATPDEALRAETFEWANRALKAEAKLKGKDSDV